MEYGEHGDLVEEVIEFAKSGRILIPSAALPPDIAVIYDLKSAKHMAWEQIFGDAEYLWTDIREKEMSQVKAVGYTIPGFAKIRDDLSQLLKLFTTHIRRNLNADYSDLTDDIVADLHNCSVALAVRGNAPGFFPTMLATYKAGGWPCGWEGGYPLGRMVGFFSKEFC